MLSKLNSQISRVRAVHLYEAGLINQNSVLLFFYHVHGIQDELMTRCIFMGTKANKYDNAK